VCKRGELCSGILASSHPEALEEEHNVTLQRKTNKPTRKTVCHRRRQLGEALVHYPEGEIEYRVADQVYRLEAGDRFLLEATQLYAYHNVSQVPAIVPVIFQVVQVHGLARQHH
jgi:quercetin dioxygenase-like cupin family protein